LKERLLRLPFGFLEGKACPQYVLGGVDVGVGLVTAGHAAVVLFTCATAEFLHRAVCKLP